MAPARPWADLSPDLLLDVSARLRDAADFVRFHAVCKPWRDSTLLSPATARPAFLPRLLASCNGRILRSRVNYSRSASPADHRSCASLGDEGDRGWVASADGTAAWLFHAADADEKHPSPRLLDLLTGAVTPLPPFTDDEIRQQMANPRGVVYGDGTVFLYGSTPRARASCIPEWRELTAALLRPGDSTWAVTGKSFHLVETHHDYSAAYHDGKIHVCDADHWCIHILDNRGWHHTSWYRYWEKDRSYLDDDSYLFESRGELLWVSVLLLEPDELGGGGSGSPDGDDLAAKLSVRVWALKVDGNGVAFWEWGQRVERNGHSLGDRVLFLGSPVSFAADAAQLGLSGGCVYFFFRGRVMTYDLINGEAKLLGRLPPEFDANGSYVWLSPQPTIAPISGNQTRLEPPNKKQRVSIF